MHADHSLGFDGNAPEKFTMINAPATAQHYGPVMRDVRGRHRVRLLSGLYVPGYLRRLADMLIAGLLLAVTAPLILLVAAALRFESSGPIIERQCCIGQGGRRFQSLKFRTIIYDPEGTLPLWARRPTPLGEFLRLTRIEALPQLINVLRGEMGMIDPKRRSPSFLD